MVTFSPGRAGGIKVPAARGGLTSTLRIDLRPRWGQEIGRRPSELGRSFSVVRTLHRPQPAAVRIHRSAQDDPSHVLVSAAIDFVGNDSRNCKTLTASPAEPGELSNELDSAT